MLNHNILTSSYDQCYHHPGQQLPFLVSLLLEEPGMHLLNTSFFLCYEYFAICFL